MAASRSDVRIPETPARRFRTSDRCTEGVTSVSFFGTDPALDTPVVVKVLRPEAFPSPLERQRIVRELKRQVGVLHPSLVRVIAAEEEGGVVWVARDWIEGQPLSDRIARGSITIDEAARWTAQLAEALGELHRLMLLHRDVRPAHVILALDGRARLIDASCGRFFRGPDGKPVYGTPGFVAPEVIAGKLINARSDLYSLGATAFAMLQGTPPFGTGDDATLIERALRADAPKPSRGPEGLIAAIASMLAREPRERPFHALQVAQQLAPFFKATGDAAIAADDDGPPTTAIDEAMVSKALVVSAGPSIVDDEFDDAAVTEVARVNMDEFALPATAPPIASAVAPSSHSAAIHAPVPSFQSGPQATAVAPSSFPASSVKNQGAQSVVRKATLIGMAPVPTGPAAFDASMPPSPVAKAPTTDSSFREHSGTRAATKSDFDEDEPTVVSEDSRIFGHAQPHAPSAHGTAVPPLPEDVSKRVLQKGGNVSAPIEARSVRVPPPPSRTVTGSMRVSVPPVAIPSLPRPESESRSESLLSNGEPTKTANVVAMEPATETSVSNAVMDDAQFNISITEPSIPNVDDDPEPVAPASSCAAQPHAQRPMSPQSDARQQPPVHKSSAQGQPSAPLQIASHLAQDNVASPVYPAAAAGYPPHAATAAYPALHPNRTGANPVLPHLLTGAYGAAHPNATASSWPQQPPTMGSLVPWVVAGCFIALVAGATGYGLALRHRSSVSAVVESRPNHSTPSHAAGANDTQRAVVQTPSQLGTDATEHAANTAVSPTLAASATDSGLPVTIVRTEPSSLQSSGLRATNGHSSPTSVETAQTGAAGPVRRTPTDRNQPTQANRGARSAPSVSTPTPLQQARAAFNRQDYPQARQILESWVRLHPNDAQAFLLLGDVRFAQGERRPAGDAYRAAIAAGNYATVYWRRLVERQLSIGDRTGAINTLNDVLRHKPGDREATRQLQLLQGGGPAPATASRSTEANSIPAFGAPNRTAGR